MRKSYFLSTLSILCLFVFTTNSFAQYNIQVTIDDGEVTTTCGDVFGAPDPLWSVNIENTGWQTYPSDGTCFNSVPNVQFNQDYICDGNVPLTLEICFRAFENDPGLFDPPCTTGEACQQDICQNFPIPPQGSANHSLALPSGLSSGGSVDFTITTSGLPGGINDLPCDAFDFGVVPFAGVIGDADVSTYNNYCANNDNEPNPTGFGFYNNIGVWHQFTTDSNPGSVVKIEAKSDPSGLGDPLSLQLGLYETSDQTCTGTFSLIKTAFTPPTLDEVLLLYCLDPNTTYFILVDGVVDVDWQLEGQYGMEVQDMGSVEGGDLICEAENMGIVPEGGSIVSNLSSNVCATDTDDPFFTGFPSTQSVWFAFTPPPSGHVTIDAISDVTDTDPIGLQFAVFGSSNNSCNGVFTQVGSSFTPADFDESMELSCLDPSATYFILVDGSNADTEGIFSMMITDAGDDTPILDQQITLCAGDAIIVGDNTYDQTGVYQDVIILSDGCDSIVNTDLIILQPVQIDVSILQEATNVGTLDGEAMASAIGGTGNYTFSWSNAGMGANQSNLEGGALYCVTVTDSNMCEDDTCFTMSFLINFQPVISGDFLDCFGDSDGMITLSATLGQPPYNFSWDNASNSLSGAGIINFAGDVVTIDNLPADDYTVSITDGNFDTVLVTTVTQPPLLEMNLVNTINASCFSFCDGSLEVEPIGGTPPYQTVWSNGDSGTLINDLCAGAFEVIVTDDNGCTTSLNLDITEPIEFIAMASELQAVSCFGGSDGQVTVTTNGSPASYLWNTGATTATVTDLSGGVYQVTITNADGCTTTANTLLNSPTAPVSVNIIEIQSIICNGELNGGLEAIPSGAGTSFTYNWSSGSQSAIADNLGAGDYGVTISNENGCTAVADFTLTEPTEISADFFTTSVTCLAELNDGTVTVENATGGVPPYQYSIDGVNFIDVPLFENLFEGIQEITVLDNGGCSKTFETTIGGIPDIVIDLGGDQEILLGDSVILTALVNTPNLIYQWEPVGLVSCVDCRTVSITPIDNIEVTVTAIDELTQCTATDKIQIEVIKTRRVFIPNAFSPDGDGFNDFFTIYGGQDVEMIQAFKIFNRYGALVFDASKFQTEDFNNAWDGTFNGEKLDPDVFVYFAQIQFIDGAVEMYRGDVMLVR